MRRAILFGWIRNGDQGGFSAKEQRVLSNCRRGQALCAEGIGGEELEFGTRLKDMNQSLFAGQKDFVLRGYRGRGEAGFAAFEARVIKFTAGGGVEAGEDAVPVATVEAVAEDDGGGDVAAAAVGGPGDGVAGELA